MHLVLGRASLGHILLLMAACARTTEGPAELEELDADDVRALAAEADKPVLVSLWATWCTPCLEEMGALTRFQAAHPDVLVLGLSTDDPGMPGVLQRVERVLATQRPGYRQARIAPSGEDALMRAFGRPWDGMLPKLVLVGPDGVTRLIIEQAVDDQLLARLVAPRLAPGSGGPAPR